MKLYREILETIINDTIAQSPNTVVDFKGYNSLTYRYAKMNFPTDTPYYPHTEMYQAFTELLKSSNLGIADRHIVNANGEVLTWETLSPYINSWLPNTTSVYDELMYPYVVNDILDTIQEFTSDFWELADTNIPVGYIVPEYDDLLSGYFEYFNQVFLNLYRSGIRIENGTLKDQNYEDISLSDIKNQLKREYQSLLTKE